MPRTSKIVAPTYPALPHRSLTLRVKVHYKNLSLYVQQGRGRRILSSSDIQTHGAVLYRVAKVKRPQPEPLSELYPMHWRAVRKSPLVYVAVVNILALLNTISGTCTRVLLEVCVFRRFYDSLLSMFRMASSSTLGVRRSTWDMALGERGGGGLSTDSNRWKSYRHARMAVPYGESQRRRVIINSTTPPPLFPVEHVWQKGFAAFQVQTAKG